MWFFVAVLILWSSTAIAGHWDSWVLPPLVDWTWWTFHLYVVGIAATTTRFLSLSDRIMGLFGFVMVVFYYRLMSEEYLKFVPTDADNPDLWPTIFLAVNLLGPLLLVTVGLLGTAVQGRGRG